MQSQEEIKEWVQKAWNSFWLPGSDTVSEYLTEDAELSAFSPPKQTTWKGLPEITKHFAEIAPVISSKSFDITRLDVVNESDTFYVAWQAEFEFNIPGQERIAEGNGIMYIKREGGKAKIWTTYEDPTPFVAMAAKGHMGQH